MSSVNKKKAVDLSNEIKRLYPEYEKFRTRIESKGEKELSEQEVQKYSDLKDKLMKSVENTTKDAYKFMDAPTLVKVQSIVEAKNEKRTVFTYQPKTSASDLIVVTSTDIGQGTINGSNKKFIGLPDDLFSFAHQPTLQILGRKDLSLDNWKPIYEDSKGMQSEYSISCSFRLNRFPTRTWYKSVDSTYQNNTTRRTEIMRFQYSDYPKDGYYPWRFYNFISIGAVAPYGNIPFDVGSPNYEHKRTFKEKYSPFSIGVSFPLSTGAQTIYTDYKFELKKWYNLKIDLVKIDTLNNTYKVQLYVNGILQETAIANVIPWNRMGSKYLRKNLFKILGEAEDRKRNINRWSEENRNLLLASLPGFNHNSNDEVIGNLIKGLVGTSQNINSYHGDMNSIPNNEEIKDFRFNVLSSIVTPPYHRNLSQYHNTSSLIGMQSPNHTRKWNKHKQKMNTSIDYGDITISIK